MYSSLFRSKSRSKSKLSKSSKSSKPSKSLLQLISLPIFIVSLSIGLFVVYITNPKKDVIYIYPKPDNVDKMQYKDKGGDCFQFESKEIQCPVDSKDIQEYEMHDNRI